MASDSVINDFEMSKYQCEFGVLTRPDGSAILNQNGTIMIAAVYGPLEAKPQKLQIEKTTVETYYRPKFGIPGVADRFKESVIRNTCEIALMATLYPRTSISVILQEVQNCGQLLSCAVNAACFALLNSGIEMKYLVGAVTCVVDESNEIIVNPKHLVVQKAQAHLTFVFDSIKLNLIASHTSGTYTEAQYLDATEKSREACTELFVYYKKIITHELSTPGDKSESN